MTLYVRIAAVLIVLLALFGEYKYVKHLGYQECAKDVEAKSLKTVLAYEDRLKKAEEKRNEDQTTIDRLTAESRRLRVHIPVCGNNAGAKDQGGREGLLSDRVDQSFARLQERATELFKRCDELNLDAIKVNEVGR